MHANTYSQGLRLRLNTICQLGSLNWSHWQVQTCLFLWGLTILHVLFLLLVAQKYFIWWYWKIVWIEFLWLQLTKRMQCLSRCISVFKTWFLFVHFSHHYFLKVMPRQYMVDDQFNEKERMTQSFDVQLHSRSLLSHLSNKGNFGARVLFELCYIKARRNFFKPRKHWNTTAPWSRHLFH